MRLIVLIISIIGVVIIAPFMLAGKLLTTTFTYLSQNIVVEIFTLINLYKQQMEQVRLAKKMAIEAHKEDEKKDNLIEMKRDDLFQEEKKEETKQ